MSLSEGIPVSIMEAISFGIPIIATNVGGNAEIVNDETGVLIPVNIDQAAFNETVSDIMNKMDILKISTIYVIRMSLMQTKTTIAFIIKLLYEYSSY